MSFEWTFTEFSSPPLGSDEPDLTGHSYVNYLGQGGWRQSSADTWFIRAEVDPIFPPPPTPSDAPVGGVLTPVNKVAILAPYLALFGIVAVAAVIVWKRSEN